MRRRPNWPRGVMLMALCGALWSAAVSVTAQSEALGEAQRLNGQVASFIQSGAWTSLK